MEHVDYNDAAECMKGKVQTLFGSCIQSTVNDLERLSGRSNSGAEYEKLMTQQMGDLLDAEEMRDIDIMACKGGMQQYNVSLYNPAEFAWSHVWPHICPTTHAYNHAYIHECTSMCACMCAYVCVSI